jgi:hypothetical protein
MKHPLPVLTLIGYLICACSVTPVLTPDIKNDAEGEATQIAALSQPSIAHPAPTQVVTPVPLDFSKAIANELGLVGTEVFVTTNYNDGKTAMGGYSHYGAEFAVGWWFAKNDNSSQWVLTYVNPGDQALCSQVEWLHSRTTYPVYPLDSTGCIP